MPRFTAESLCFALLVFVAHGANEPHLRSEIIGDVVSKQSHDGEPAHGMGGTFSVEKGMKCQGGFKDNHGGKNCQGSMKSEFTVGFRAEDVAKELASQLWDAANDFLPDREAFYPDDETMQGLLEFDNQDDLELLEEGHSKTIEFGGFIKAGYGCKVTYGREGGKFTKKTECGFKGFSGGGMKPGDEELYPFDNKDDKNEL